jgi:hypothetical protein
VIQGGVPTKKRVGVVADEFETADFGDERLRRRLLTVADAAAAAPSSSFPQMTGSDGELEGVYRFLSNERVKPEGILLPHLLATLARAREEPDVLVVHDTTLFTFGGTSPRAGLGWIHKHGGSQGFFGHFAMAVAADGTRRPLGLAGLTTLVREGKPLGRHVDTRRRNKRGAKESDRWIEVALAVHERLPGAVHVMDREGDSFDLYDSLSAAGISHVIRAREGRNRIAVENGERIPVSELAAQQPVVLPRTVALARRTHQASMGTLKKFHPARHERKAQLEVRARAVSLPRPTDQSRWIKPRQIPVNVVLVTERGQPKGVEPVSWMLITNLPISTKAEVERIVDAYRARWIIEEFFKALKTGCAFEKRQLETFHSLMNALALFCVIAWRLLVLRATARDAPDAPAERALTRRQVQVLQAVAELRDPRFRRVVLPSVPRAREVLNAVAGLGGHLKNNGLPGWQVLSRGYDALLLLELGWRARDAM